MYIEVIKTSKITIFQPTYSSSGSLVARAPPDSSGCRWDRTPLQMCGVTHTHPHSSVRDILERPVHFMCTTVRCGRKPESGRNPSQTWGRRAKSTQTAASAQRPFLPPHRWNDKTTPKDRTLRQDLYLQSGIAQL